MGIGAGTAILGSGAISGLSSIIGGGKQASAASQAAQAQVQAAEIAQQTQLQMFQTAYNALNPYMQYGTGAIGAMQGLTGTGPGATAQSVLTSPLLAPIQTQWPTFSMTEDQLKQTPGYQFQTQVGSETIANQMAAKGLRMGGAFGTALTQYMTGLADTTYSQQLANYQSNVAQSMQEAQLTLNDRAQILNALGGQIQVGVGAAGALTGASLQTGQGVAQTQLAQGAATAGGILGQANAFSGALSGVSGAASNTALLYAMNQGGLFGNTGAGFNAANNVLIPGTDTALNTGGSVVYGSNF